MTLRRTSATIRVGIAGTGYIARGLALHLQDRDDQAVSAVLTRRRIGSVAGFARSEWLTNSIDEFLKGCDIVVECSGDPIYAADVVGAAFDVAKPVVTMNAEFHVTLGSWFVGKGLLSEAEGDQPGSLAALREDALEMGFRPLVYGNCKGFLDHTPTLASMRHWSRKLSTRIDKVVSFTDGTKIQIEQALVANGLGAGILRDGLLGPTTDDLGAAATDLAKRARRQGGAISDYVIAPNNGGAVFLVAEHDDRHRQALENFKLGKGPDYLLTRNFHLCHLEIPKTVKRLVTGGQSLLTNGRAPEIDVCAIAKHQLEPGDTIGRGLGSFEVRGEAVDIGRHPGYVPIGLLKDAVVRRPVAAGARVLREDVDLPKSRALEIWDELRGRRESSPPEARQEAGLASAGAGAIP